MPVHMAAAMVPSLRMSYRRVRPRQGAASAWATAFRAARSDQRVRLAGSGWLTPRTRTSRMCAPTIATSTTGSRTTCQSSIWPKFMTLKNAPPPTALNASLPLVAIHCESKFC